MRQVTIKKYTDLLNAVKNSGLSLFTYCKQHDIKYSSISALFTNLRKENSEETKELLNLYSQVINKGIENLDTDDKSEISITREEGGRIISYNYKIYRKNKTPLIGRLNREEMNLIHRLYSYYGDSLTQRVVSRHFVDLSLIDFKRILRAFQITKASSPFAPHYYEEYTEEELRDIQLREKENSFLRKAEEDLIKNNEKLLKAYAQENINLKSSLNRLSNINITFTNTPIYKATSSKAIESDKDLILHLSDMHIGAKVESGCIYPNDWNERELLRRLSAIIERIKSLGHLNTLVINLLGDSLDGMDNQTARRDHFMPQNMDNMEQVNTFINTMCWFIGSVNENNLCNNIKIYAVKAGNHGGITEYASSCAALSCIKQLYPKVEVTQFTEFFGYYEFKQNKWLICHGKIFYKF